MLFTNHKTRITDLIAVLFAVLRPGGEKVATQKPPPGHCFPAPVRVAGRGITRQGALRAACPRQQHGRLGFHETRDTKHGSSLSLRRLQGEQLQGPANGFFTNHESRVTNHGLYRRPDRRARRPLTTSLRISTRPFLDILGLLPPDYVFLPPDYDFFRIFTVLLPHYSPEFFGIPRNSSDNPPSRCPRSVRRSRSASRRAPSAAAPAALRAASAAAKEK